MEIPGYKIHRVLGKGGMATVFLATQESFNRKVAIKVLAPNYAEDEDFASRFIREARIVAGLSHPHIIPVYDVGQHGQHLYLSMEYLAGGELSTFIKSGLLEEEAVQIAIEIASALHYSHQKGYIHRDIKPDNIMFREDNSAVLTDFGIACLQDANDRITRAGAIVGTPRYMSPEQIRAEDIDGRADLYALGIVFYEMLVKETPFQAADFTALAVKHVNDPVPQLPKIFSKYQTFVDKALAKQPGERFQNGREMAKALKVVSQSPSSEQPVSRQAKEKNIELKAQDNEKSAKAKQTKVTPAQPTAKTQAQAANIKEGVNFSESSYRKGLVLKRYSFDCELGIRDALNFNIVFSQITTKLLEWHDLRENQCGRINLQITSSPMAFDKIKSSIKKLYESGDVFDFLQSLEFNVTLISPDNAQMSYTLPEST